MLSMNRLEPKFDLGKVTVQKEAAYALSLAGQDADFFLGKHASGDCGEEDPAMSDPKKMLVSKYHTLKNHELYVVTFPEKGETMVFCPPNSVIRHEPLFDFVDWKV
jgi:hypothetical protein